MLISGERLQALSQISFCSSRNCIIDNQLKQIPQNLHLIESFPVDQIKNYSVIFCYTHDIDCFMQRFYEHFNNDTVLITHNSDNGIDSSYEKFLNSDKIKTWYCQNRYFIHPKLISLPIGIANSQWPHGDQSTLQRVRNELNDKIQLVYKNFNISTNTSVRAQCDNDTRENGIQMSAHTTTEEYWRSISKSYYTISPPGNGIDCHRIWECIALRSIPIVLKHEALAQFSSLPILLVDSYKEITEEMLRNKLTTIYNAAYNTDIIDIDYWKNIVK